MENSKSKNLHWFPGHMKKATVKLEENAKFVDFVIVILDSRAPLSSYNEGITKIFQNKPKLFILNKIDISNENETKKWLSYFSKDEDRAITLNSTKNLNKVLQNELQILTKKKKEKSLNRGIKRPIFKGIVIGVPNCGKSTFINGLIGKSRLDAQDRPGVTRSATWIKISDDFLLMDTPGILTPKFEDKETAIKLALIGSIKLDIVPFEEITKYLVSFLFKYYEADFNKYLKVDNFEDKTAPNVINHIAKTMVPLLKGAELDLEMANKKLLNDFRDGKIAKITLDIIE